MERTCTWVVCRWLIVVPILLLLPASVVSATPTTLYNSNVSSNLYSTSNLLFLEDDTSSVLVNRMFTRRNTIANNNVAPSITPVNNIPLPPGAPGANIIIANVSDAEDSAGSLEVSTISQPLGISVFILTNSNMNGTITANIATGCNATPGPNIVGLRVTDSAGATTDANLVITIDPNLGPTLGTYSNSTVILSGSITITPSAPPARNDALSTVTANAPGFGGVLSVDRAGVVSVSNARPVGSYVVTLTTANTCGTTTSTAFTLDIIVLNTSMYLPLLTHSITEADLGIGVRSQ